MLPAISLIHLQRMLGPHGLYQHARGTDPLLSEGYCVDDNARAVQVVLSLMPHVPESSQAILRDAISLCWNYVKAAEYEPGKMYNFRTSQGVWLTQDVSADMYARVLRCCAAIGTEEAVQLAQRILIRYKECFASPRAWAEVLVALSLFKKNSVDIGDMSIVEDYCAGNLARLWQKHSSTSWPWFEDSLTYANAILHHGLLHHIGTKKTHARYEEMVRVSSKFLIETTIKDDIFIPIGNDAWHAKGTQPSLYDQQPIEAGVMLDFLLDLQTYDDSAVTVPQVAAPYLWFFGKNTKGVSLVNVQTGACFDALTPHGPNTNCGAESLLAYLWAQARMREASEDVLTYVEEELKKK